ncbi:shikimate kinase AroK [Geopseudomonas guangdongensis]|uniref:Shikimate kinase n=1 Tax=Geopseudomonas guangdongensis TaxID=1245526 RepID=A0A1H2G5J7_9GAMM|nr:shikimate kinase AroK [Pseudomonas guangdongensis]MBP9955815.1 shikimate kinase AroK [Pseudomonas sp.]SDU14855.1 shikimate kinase [Pseudomonas guangdongensis]
MRNLILVGPMGAGKSTIGRLLAKELHLPFKDSDKEIEVRTGADIPWIFDVEGEAGFREREQAVLADLCREDGLVLATGGGAVLRAENRAALHAGGRVIYLHTSVEQQLERTARDRNRPLLRTANPGQVLRELLATRDPLYREIADVVIETDQRPPRMVVQEILSRLEQLPPR